MRPLAHALFFVLLTVSTAHAADTDILRLSCRPSDPAASPPLNFTIDLVAKDAVESASGSHYGVTSYRDGLGLYDPAQGPAATVYRLDRNSGRFARVDVSPRWDGTCDGLSPKP